MATISGTVTTYNRPNFVGPLFQVSPTDTPFLTAVGESKPIEVTQNKLFTWQTEDLATPDPTGKLEVSTPDYAARSVSELSNVVQIFHRGVSSSYSALGNAGLLDPTAGTAGGTDANGQPVLGTNPVPPGLNHQVMLKMQEIKRSMEQALLYNAFVNPANDATARSTRGIMTAISGSQAIALDAGAGAPADIYGDRITGGTNDSTLGTPIGMSYVDNLLKAMYDSDAPLVSPVIFVNSTQKIKLTLAYSANGALVERSRTLGGMKIDEILTEYGWVGIVLDRWVAQTDLLVADMSVLKLRTYEVPNKGVFFVEPKPADDSTVKAAIYGEFGLEYGPPTWHGKITNLK